MPFLPPNVSEQMVQADFWLEQMEDPDRLLASNTEISFMEKKTAERMAELGLAREYTLPENFKTEISIAEVKELMESYSLPDCLPDYELYSADGEKYSQEWQDNLIKESNLEALTADNQRVEGRPGLTVRRLSVRAFPTEQAAVKDPEAIDVDRFQLTAIQAGSPVMIWHQSLSGKWSFIQSQIYSGWVLTEYLAVADDLDMIIDYWNQEERLVVTGSRTETEPNPFFPGVSNIFLQLGDSLPLYEEEAIPAEVPAGAKNGQAPAGCHVAKVPLGLGARVDRPGRLEFAPALLPFSQPVRIGFNDFTKRNLIEAAFKCLGERYGWGGLFQRRDCSRLVFDIYRQAGLTLPRDAGKPQEEGAAGRTIYFKGNRAERLNQLKELEPGDPVYLPGHVMVYLGRANKPGTDEVGHYVIHSGSGYGELVAGELKSLTVHSTFVMELETYLQNKKKTYLEALTLGRKFRADIDG
ncbi:MAG: SH3 domain-containing protein [Halanaerobiaceae bacterium]